MASGQFWRWLANTFAPNASAQQEANQQADEAMQNLENLLPQYEEQYQRYLKEVNTLFENNPELDLSSFINILSDFSSELSGVRTGTERDVGRYLNQGREYTSSMLDEIMGSTGDYLTGYKKLARTEMPGTNVLRDQLFSNLSTGLQTLRSSGASSPNSLVQLLQGNQNQMAGLALEAGRYKTQSEKDLANAYLTYGTTRAGAYNTASQFSQNAANLRTGLGEFSAGILGQQSNIAGQQAAMTNQMFQSNEFTPWMTELNWNMSQAQAFNPLDFAANLYGSQVGFYEGESDEARQQRQANMQMFLDLITTYMGAGGDLTSTMIGGGG